MSLAAASILDPTAADVKALDDKQLRELVARLGAAELRARGQSETGVFSQGHQNASDGGIDVRLEGASTAAADVLIRLPLGIQVKATPVRKAAVKGEMRKDGALRPSIVALAKTGGAYVIAGGRNDLSETALAAMRAAMKDALGDDANLPIDFYDAGRLARWAAQHPSVAVWLVETAGRPAHGWRGQGSWSTPEGSGPYIFDERARVVVGREDSDSIAVVGALDQLRAVLSRPGSAARLVGVSGMGKTRLAEALFEASTSDAPLSGGWAVYGDVGTLPPGAATAMAHDLVARKRRAILVVDNCPVALHRALVDIIRPSGQVVSLLTLDFDVGPDAPDHTTVFRLGDASESLIETLLRQRAPQLHGVDRDRIVAFSLGNARLALTLARTVEAKGGLAGLQDRDLVDRLFLDARRGVDLDLRSAAQASALVNAFEVSGPIDQTEADRLAALVGLKSRVFTLKIGDLLDRGLAQQRGVQRAILPPAVAVWLAEEMLRRLPAETVVAEMVETAPVRLRKSFLRRLADLHETDAARRVARLVLRPDGLFSSPSDLFGEDIKQVAALAHLAPDEALVIAGRAVDRETRRGAGMPGDPLVRLLRAMAYDAARFDMAVELLARLARTAVPMGIDRVSDYVLQLFQPLRAGTQASPVQRLAVIDRWLSGKDADRKSLAMDALDSVVSLESHRHHLPADFPRRQDYGWRFSTMEVYLNYLQGGLDRLAARTGEDARRATEIFLKRFPELAEAPDVQPTVLRAFPAFEAKTTRPQAWFTACRALARVAAKDRGKELLALEARLRPLTISDRFDTWIVADWRDWHDPEGDRARDWETCKREAEAVGAEVASDPNTWIAYVDRVLDLPATAAGEFGAGLAHGTADMASCWRNLIAAVKARPEGAANLSVLVGYVRGARTADPMFADTCLDACAADPAMATAAMGMILSRGDIDDWALDRCVALLASPANDEALEPIWCSRLSPSASQDRVVRVIDGLIARGLTRHAHGFLDAWLHDGTPDWGASLAAAGRRLLESDLSQAGQLNDYFVAQLVERVLNGSTGEKTARRLLRRLMDQAAQKKLYRTDLPKTALAVASRYPEAALDMLLVDEMAEEGMAYYNATQLLRRIDDDDHTSHNAFQHVDPDLVFRWVAVDPADRAHRAMRVVPYFENADGTFDWTPVARGLIDRWDDPRLLDALHDRLASGASSGPSVNRHMRRRAMVSGLVEHKLPGVRAWAVDLLPIIDERIQQHLELESARDMRFE